MFQVTVRYLEVKNGKKSKYFFNNASSYVGVGTAIGVAMHAATSEPT